MPYVICGLLLLAMCHVFAPRLYFAWQRRRLLQRCRRDRLILLTFDDGPGKRLTPILLDRLRRAQARATFFVLGRNVPGNEDLVRRMQAEGHEIGCHGQDHSHYVFCWPGQGIADIRRAWRTLQPLTPEPATRLPFRPPFGKLTLTSLLYLKLRRTPIITWTQDGMDTRPDRQMSPTDVAGLLRAQGGGIVLLHDFDRNEEPSSQDVLLRLDEILKLRAEGFRFVGLGQVLQNSTRAMLSLLTLV